MLPYVNDINLKGDIGNTALHYAISTRQIPVVELLIFNGANIAQGNDYGDTPLDYMGVDEKFSPLLRKLKPEVK
jgi:ankyrin repeat protein